MDDAHFPRSPLCPGDACLTPLELLLNSEQLVLILILIAAPVLDLSLLFFCEFFICFICIAGYRESPIIQEERQIRMMSGPRT